MQAERNPSLIRYVIWEGLASGEFVDGSIFAKPTPIP